MKILRAKHHDLPGLVDQLLLNGVLTDLLRLPWADVSDFSACENHCFHGYRGWQYSIPLLSFLHRPQQHAVADQGCSIVQLLSRGYGL